MTRLLTLLTVALVLVAYAPVRSAGFVYEDQRWLQAVEDLSTEHYWLSRPVMLWSLWLQQGMPPWTYHAVNVGLHLLTALSVGSLFLSLGLSSVAAWIGLSVFALHPIHTEAVASVAGRPELLAALGIVIASCGALRQSWPGLLVCLLGMTLALLSKETAVVAVVLIPSLVYYKSRMPTTHIVLIVIGICILGARMIGPKWSWPFALTALDAAAWAMTQLTAAHRLLMTAIVPMTLTVDFDYDHISVVGRVIAMLTWIGIIGWGWSIRHRWPLMTLGLVWIVVPVALRLMIYTPRSPFNEHQFYTPMIGVALIASGVYEYACQQSHSIINAESSSTVG